MFAGEDIARSTHIGCELINLVELPVEDIANQLPVTKVAEDKVVRRGLREFGALEIYAADPEALRLQPSHEVASNEATGAIHQCGRTAHNSSIDTCEQS